MAPWWIIQCNCGVFIIGCIFYECVIHLIKANIIYFTVIIYCILFKMQKQVGENFLANIVKNNIYNIFTTTYLRTTTTQTTIQQQKIICWGLCSWVKVHDGWFRIPQTCCKVVKSSNTFKIFSDAECVTGSLLSSSCWNLGPNIRHSWWDKSTEALNQHL